MTIESKASSNSPTDYYQSRLESHQLVAREIANKKQYVTRSRLLVLAVWLVLFVLALNGYLSIATAIAFAGLAFLGFVFLAAWDELLSRKIRVSNEYAEIARIQLARMNRAWKDVPEVDVLPPEHAREVSYDLDLFGHASLFQLLCRANTTRGREILRDWIATPAEPATVQLRNDAAASLSPMRVFREDFDLQGRVLQSSAAGPAAFVDWAEGERWIEKRAWLTWLSRASVAAWILTIAFAIMGFVPEMVAVGICCVIGLLHLALSVMFSGTVHDIFERVDSRQNDVQHYRELLKLTEDLPAEPTYIGELRNKLGAESARPRQALTKLSNIMKIAQMRHSSVLGLIHLFLQLLFLIDFHVLHWLESWHRDFGSEVRGWFQNLGELEAVSSLASLVHDNPAWVFPSYKVEHDRVQAESIGHPLLVDPICNTVEVGPPGRFLLVTGSNMSGKSTLLRTLGLNATLAQAGAPVAAKSFSLPPVELATSMRIQDSLEDGVSFFMAELQRLKEVVDHAERLTDQPRSLLFLLDEILQGTNSAERHIAVANVISRLTENHAFGAVSTHDLELASNSELTPLCETVHFKESFTDDGKMTFDYQMREGVATTSNALKLLELVGIRSEPSRR